MQRNEGCLRYDSKYVHKIVKFESLKLSIILFIISKEAILVMIVIIYALNYML
ncbi:MAG: hypothetical protein K0S67_2020 [Nitrososphaeraceae archaeon]|jgi:hypothetical protein|nr:hypothetical protein [Nitrososphaeraceae archaeon]